MDVDRCLPDSQDNYVRGVTEKAPAEEEENFLAAFLPLFGAGETNPGDDPVADYLRMVKDVLGAGEVQFWHQAGSAGWAGFLVRRDGTAARGTAGNGICRDLLEKLASLVQDQPLRGEFLIFGGRAIKKNGFRGVIIAGGEGPADHVFSEALGRALFQGAADRVENAALILKLDRASNDLEALGLISSVMSLTADFSTILGQCIEQIKNVIGADSGGVLLFEPASNKLVLQRPAFGADRENFSGYALEVPDKERPGMGAAVRVFITGHPYISNSPSEDPVSKRDLVEKYGIHCSLTVPLAVDNRRLGVLHLVNRHRGSFNSEDARLALILASKLAVVIDNARLFANLETKNRLLQRAIDIHNQLTRIVLEGKGIEAITVTLAQLLNRPVQVEDQCLRPLAFGRPPGSRAMAAGPETIREEVLFDPEIQKHFAGLQNGQRPLSFPNWDRHGLSAPRVMAPIRVGGETLGYVSVLASEGGFEDLDFVAVEHAATVYALQFMQIKVACEVEEKIRGQFVEDLVYGRLDEGDILQRALYLGYDLRNFYQVMIVHVNTGSTGGTDTDKVITRDFSGLSEKALKVIRQCTRDQGFHFIAARTNPLLVLIETGAGPQKHRVHDLAAIILQRVKEDLGALAVTVGIGGPAKGVKDLRLSYKQAEKAFRIAGRLKWTNVVVPFDSIGVHRVFLHVDRREILRDYVMETLGAILDYDRERKGNLMATLRAFIDCNFNLQKTAQHLFIHLNTLKYRMQRIREIGDLSLDNPNQRFNVQFAIKILDTLED